MYLKRKTHGILISTEALVVSLLISVLVFFAYIYATNTLHAEPKLAQTTLEVRLCGYVITIKNVGTTRAVITAARGEIFSTGSSYDITDQLPGYLDPGDSTTITLDMNYDRVIITGENFEMVSAKNECQVIEQP